MSEKVIEHSLLSDKALLKHMERGTVVIEPFRRENLSTSSYDVTLGPFFYRETNPEPGHGTHFFALHRLSWESAQLSPFSFLLSAFPFSHVLFPPFFTASSLILTF